MCFGHTKKGETERGEKKQDLFGEYCKHDAPPAGGMFRVL
jgi:hypothetical protein